MRRALVWSGGLILAYLALSHATGAGTLMTDAANASQGLVKTFQGR